MATPQFTKQVGVLRDPLLVDPRSDAASTSGDKTAELPPTDPIAMRITVKSVRIIGLTTLTVLAAVALMVLLSFTGGIVVDTYARQEVSIKQQEDLLERYNSYSGTVTAAIERPLEMFAAVLVQVIVLRFMADDVLHVEKRWRVGAAVVVVGAATTYLLSNGLSAVNVQAKERPVQSVIVPNDLSVAKGNLSETSTLEKPLSENRPDNHVTNTILRNLILLRATDSQRICNDESMDQLDDVLYQLPQRPWMKDIIPYALPPSKSMTMAISELNSAANEKLTPDDFPMNVSTAADLLIYSVQDRNAWMTSSFGLLDQTLGPQIYREQNGNVSGPSLEVPCARLSQLLPATLKATEREDREWFLKHSGPRMYNFSNPDLRNGSLRSWTMTFSRVDIEPNSVWVDAVTIEREMANPRLQTNTSKDKSTRYYELSTFQAESQPNYVPIEKAGSGVFDDGIDVYSVCTDREGSEMITSTVYAELNSVYADCPKSSNQSLLVVSRGRHLVADAFVENASLESYEVVRGHGSGVVVNMREIFSVTVARISWTLHDLSARYNAQCAVQGGCLGLDVALADSRQRLEVSANAAPVSIPNPLIQGTRVGPKPIPIVGVKRPQVFNRYRGTGGGEYFIGDILLPHNIRNISVQSHEKENSCLSEINNRMAMFVNNHVYIENTLQAAYTGAAFYLFQSGVARDILNQSTTTHTLLAFQGNVQNVDVYVYIPTLNAILTLGGCALLVLVVLVVVLWSQVGLHGVSDPLANITTPHTIAQILLDESTFPHMLLARTITTDGKATDDADAFVIQQLSLELKDNKASTNANDSNTSTNPTVRIDP